MDDSPTNEVTVTFPSTDTFLLIGRVCVGGLALRLSLDISSVEELRVAADAAVRRLTGKGRITVKAQWSDTDLVVRIENPDAVLNEESVAEAELSSRQTTVETIFEPPHRIFLRTERESPGSGEEE